VYVLDQSDRVSRSSPSLYDWLVERVDTSTGRTSTVATVTLPEFWNGPNGTQQPDAVIADGTLFLIAIPGSGAPGFLEEVRW
jgi:hypothetical protein